MTLTVEAAADKAEIDATFRKVAWRIVPLLMICYVLAFIDRGNVGFAKLQFMGQLGFSEAVYGLGGGLFYLGYSVFEVPSNLLLARVGVRLTLLRIMVLWGLCSGRPRADDGPLALLRPAVPARCSGGRVLSGRAVLHHDLDPGVSPGRVHRLLHGGHRHLWHRQRAHVGRYPAWNGRGPGLEGGGNGCSSQKACRRL